MKKIYNYKSYLLSKLGSGFRLVGRGPTQHLQRIQCGHDRSDRMYCTELTVSGGRGFGSGPVRSEI